MYIIGYLEFKRVAGRTRVKTIKKAGRHRLNTAVNVPCGSRHQQKKK